MRFRRPHPREHPTRGHRRGVPAWALPLLLATASGCSADRGSRQGNDEKGLFEIDDLDVVAVQSGPVPIGEFLSKIDLALRAWTRLTNTADSPAERTQARQLEDFLRNETEGRRDELVQQLEVGPPFNRMRAASALGFTDATSLSPLLSALSDPEPDVVHNALLGLALLAAPETPLGGICDLVGSSPDAHVRSNAAYALRSVLEAGGAGECAVTAARGGLLDAEPLVRVQAALVLGLTADAESIPALTDQVYDELPLVSRSAVEALVFIAREDSSMRGAVARALLPATEKAPRRNRPAAKAGLIALAGFDHGAYEDWVRWAHGLP